MLRVNDHQDAGVGTHDVRRDAGICTEQPQAGFEAENRQALYGLVERVLRNQRYSKLKKSERDLVRRFLVRVSGLSRAQTTRLIGQWRADRQVRSQKPVRRRFPRRYTAEDIVLLSQVDAAHEDLSGPAVRRILWREYTVYGKSEFERLAGISVSHLYNLRRSPRYRKLRVKVEHTRASQGPSASGANPIHRANPASYEWTLCIKDIVMASPVCITSMRWTP
jgi:hypothetical protein